MGRGEHKSEGRKDKESSRMERYTPAKWLFRRRSQHAIEGPVEFVPSAEGRLGLRAGLRSLRGRSRRRPATATAQPSRHLG